MIPGRSRPWCWTCWTVFNCPAPWPTADRTSSPVARNNAWPSPAPSLLSRPSWSLMSLSPPLTSQCRLVIELLLEMQRTHGTTLLFISHDLGVVRYLADQVIVMYLGQVMERGTVDEVFAPPYHPYTEALLSAMPGMASQKQRAPSVLEGPVPSVIDPPRGCPFVTRCPRQLGALCEEVPRLYNTSRPTMSWRVISPSRDEE